MKRWERMLFNREVPTIALFAIICISGMFVFSVVTQPHQTQAVTYELPWWQRWIVNPINWAIDAFSGGSVYDYQSPPQQAPEPGCGDTSGC